MVRVTDQVDLGHRWKLSQNQGSSLGIEIDSPTVLQTSGTWYVVAHSEKVPKAGLEWRRMSLSPVP